MRTIVPGPRLPEDGLQSVRKLENMIIYFYRTETPLDGALSPEDETRCAADSAGGLRNISKSHRCAGAHRT